MLKPGILGQCGAEGLLVPVLQPHEPAQKRVPQVEAAAPECDLGFEYFVGLPQQSLLNRSESPKGGGEIAVQDEMRWVLCMGLHEEGGCPTRSLHQPSHVVRKALGVADFKPEGPCRLKVFLAHRELSRDRLHSLLEDRIPTDDAAPVSSRGAEPWQ